MREQVVDVERFAAAEGAGEITVVIGGALKDCRGGDRRDYDRSFAGGDFPECGGAFFLELRVRREILEWKHVAGGECDYAIRDRRRR